MALRAPALECPLCPPIGSEWCTCGCHVGRREHGYDDERDRVLAARARELARGCFNCASSHGDFQEALNCLCACHDRSWNAHERAARRREEIVGRTLLVKVEHELAMQAERVQRDASVHVKQGPPPPVPPPPSALSISNDVVRCAQCRRRLTRREARKGVLCRKCIDLNEINRRMHPR